MRNYAKKFLLGLKVGSLLGGTASAAAHVVVCLSNGFKISTPLELEPHEWRACWGRRVKDCCMTRDLAHTKAPPDSELHDHPGTALL